MAARPSTPPDTAADTKARPKPTLLAFHGSGSNATIHSVQLARLVRVIKPYFDIESVEGMHQVLSFFRILPSRSVLPVIKAQVMEEEDSTVASQSPLFSL